MTYFASKTMILRQTDIRAIAIQAERFRVKFLMPRKLTTEDGEKIKNFKETIKKQL